MGRVNKKTAGVFTEIVGNTEQLGSYDVFIGEEKTASKLLKPFLQQYKTNVVKMKTHYERMAQLEEIIMQIRSRENMDDIKLSLVREYIYARCSFYRNDKIAKDIRIIIDTTEKYGKNLRKLSKNAEVIEIAKKKLHDAMTKEINNNIESFKNTSESN